jgi:hypothetical protein
MQNLTGRRGLTPGTHLESLRLGSRSHFGAVIAVVSSTAYRLAGSRPADQPTEFDTRHVFAMGFAIVIARAEANEHPAAQRCEDARDRSLSRRPNRTISRVDKTTISEDLMLASVSPFEPETLTVMLTYCQLLWTIRSRIRSLEFVGERLETRVPAPQTRLVLRTCRASFVDCDTLHSTTRETYCKMR